MFSLSRESEQDLAHGIIEVVERYLEARDTVKPRLTGLISAQEVMGELDIKYLTLQKWEKAGLRRYHPPLEDTRKVYYKITDIWKFMGVENGKNYDVLVRESTVSNELREATFSTFKAETQEEHEAKEFAIKQAKQYLNGMTGNTLIMGNPGTGKSHLCYSMAKAINEGYKSRNDPKSVLFVSITEIITRIQSGWQYRQSDFTEYDALKLLTEVDYLFIDDLGTESVMNSQKNEANNWVQAFLFKIFDKRDTTIINTNHNGKELARIYNDKLVSRIGKQSEGNVFIITDIKDKRMKRNF